MSKIIAGLDESGRGPLAGPVVGAIVAIQSSKIKKVALKFPEIKDSKKLTSKKRDELFKKIKRLKKDIIWKTAAVYPKTIDKINILQATLLSWKRCIKKLEKFNKCKLDLIYIDGNISIPNLNIPQITQIKGDENNFLISLASIIAKVIRDKIMKRLNQKYPQYKLSKHKGYATKLHLRLIKEYGPAKIHRKSFKPIKNFNFKSYPQQT